MDPRTGVPTATPDSQASGRDAALLRAIEVLEDSTKYPPTSRPIGKRQELLEPQYVEPRTRFLGDPSSRVEVVLKQDRLFVGAGESANATIELTDKSERLRVRAAQIQLIGSGGERGARQLGSVAFSDSGTGPDAVAQDGVFTASIRPDALLPATARTDLLVSAELVAGTASGEVSFRFVYTGVPPAAFTGTFSDSAVAGSLAIRAGVKVTRSGNYKMLGRLYGADGTPIALLKFDGRLSTASTEVEFTAYGKLLRDANAIGPFRFRDLEGWLMLEGASPDRQVMSLWGGPFETQVYSPETCVTAQRS